MQSDLEYSILAIVPTSQNNPLQTVSQHKKDQVFLHLLVNTLIASVVNFTMWFALTFFIYLESQSVLMTSTIAGLYLVLTAGSGIWFGSIVDHHKKKWAMMGSSIVSLFFFLVSFGLYVGVGRDTFQNPQNPLVWVFIALVMLGVIAGNIRQIALMTAVTFLKPEAQRDKANGLVGSASGVSFLTTSVISGLLVGFSGMFHALLLAVILTAAVILHLWRLTVPEDGVVHSEEGQSKVDIKGTIKVVKGIPGLFALIFFTTFNNFLGGVFMALMDAYGLSLVPVQTWGLLWGFLSTGFILGGLLIAKIGLGKNPLKSMFLANIVLWVVTCFFTLKSWLPLLIGGLYTYMLIVPYVEAAEQTIYQKVVPKERQGRVFGFAQSMEQAASPLTAFLIGPLAQYVFIPFMTDGLGAEAIGGWFGTGPARGMALIFTLTGVLGLIATVLAMFSKYYRQLSKSYLESN